jgi:hypothetical protein
MLIFIFSSSRISPDGIIGVILIDCILSFSPMSPDGIGVILMEAILFVIRLSDSSSSFPVQCSRRSSRESLGGDVIIQIELGDLPGSRWETIIIVILIELIYGMELLSEVTGWSSNLIFLIRF